jgi:hypothetical protein
MKINNLCLLSILFSIFLAFAVSSCIFITDGTNSNFFNPNIIGSRNVISQNRSGAVFNAVSCNGSMQVYVQQGNFYNISVRTDDNVIQYLETTVENNILNIGFRRGFSVSPSLTEVYITTPMLRSIYLNGSGSVFGQGNLNTDFLELVVNGSGNMLLNGWTDFLRITINGSGSIRTFGLNTNRADINITGSGNVEVSVTNELNAFITGSGDIYYRGNPRIATNITGSGRILRR